MSNETFINYIIGKRNKDDLRCVVAWTVMRTEAIELGRKYFSMDKKNSLWALNRAVALTAIDVRLNKIDLSDTNLNLQLHTRRYVQKEMRQMLLEQRRKERSLLASHNEVG